jgi:hypothetical protein
VGALKNNTGAVGRLQYVLSFFLWSLAAAALIVPGKVTAQPVSAEERPALEAQKEALFQQMFRDPANLDVTFAYADVSAKLGDYEAAVSALERMLLFNPNLPRVQLELGALYFKMGSYELARDYFQRAAAASPPPEVQARVEDYLTQIEKGQSRHHLSGYVFFGTQYQSNANVAGSSEILAPTFFGPQLVLLNAPFTKQSSGSILASGSLLYSYDLETQNRDSLEVTSVSYLNHYFNSLVTRLDLGLIEVTGGPRLNFPNGGLIGDKLASFKPYVILDEVGLGWNQYFNAYGGGLEYDEIVWNDMPIRAIYEFRQKNFSNASDRPLSRGLSGSDNLVSVQATKPINPNSALTFQFDYLNQSTRLLFYANRSYAATGAYRIRYQDPFGITATTWETSPFVGRAWSYYDAPDPCCVTGQNGGISTQFTRRWRLGFSHTVAVTPNIGIALQVQRDIVSSNLPLYAYTNNTIIIGPQIRF